MVPTTPGGALAREMQTTLTSCPAPGRCKTNVIEGGGVTVKQNIVKSNPFPRLSCKRPDCVLDQMSDRGCRGKCFHEGVGYVSTCTRCRHKEQEEEGKTPEQTTNHSYIGETARTLYTRTKQHLGSYRSHLPGRKPVESWMWEHALSHHGGLLGPNEGENDYHFRIQ